MSHRAISACTSISLALASKTYGYSSVGRATVSKTVGRGFESLCPCHFEGLARYRFEMKHIAKNLVATIEWLLRSFFCALDTIYPLDRVRNRVYIAQLDARRIDCFARLLFFNPRTTWASVWSFCKENVASKVWHRV